MTDFALEWNDDFQIDSTGDIATVDGDDETRQRLERRLFTAVSGYVWHPTYGAGLPQKVGSVLSVSDIFSVVNSQINLETSVAPIPAPIMSVNMQQGGLCVISIQYFDAVLARTVSFSITA